MKKVNYLFGLILPLIASGCSSVGLSALNATSRIESGHQVIKDLSYGEAAWQTLDVHLANPQDSSDTAVQASDAGRPVVVFLYGGGWTSGKKDQYYFAASAFTDQGYVVVLPDYVKYPEGKFPTFVHDSAKAIAWTKKNISQHGGNPEQIFIVGHSAGAHIGALLVSDEQYLKADGLAPCNITAFAGMAGPYNFTPEEKPYTKIFGPEENYPKMKVMNFIEGDEPPMILLHGTDDATVGILNKDSLVEKIEQAGGEYANISYPGGSHVGILLSLHPTYIGKANAAIDINRFFQTQLAKSQEHGSKRECPIS